jgi:hypothetical protein
MASKLDTTLADQVIAYSEFEEDVAVECSDFSLYHEFMEARRRAAVLRECAAELREIRNGR